MSFMYPQAIVPVILIAVVLFYLIIRFEKRYFSWVKLYWFYQRSLLSKLSTLLLIASLCCLFIALLDLRGPEERVSTDIPDQKTIILIDASSSMLVEDVRPNRFGRALFLARHFIRNAVGHQIAVVLFSDTTKRLISFTDDLDLLDARISGLEKTDLTSAGSSITTSLKESVNYFKEQTTPNEKVSGNILLITDGEETTEGLEKTLPPEVTLAVVGVGTSKGGPIPMRSRNGSFRGYKKYNGKQVTSSLDEGWLKSFGKSHELYKYWIALSYNVPTDDILSFFDSVYKDRLTKGEMRFRPVLGIPFIVSFMLLLSLSSFLSLCPTFNEKKVAYVVKQVFIFCLILPLFFESWGTIKANEMNSSGEISPKTQQLLRELEKGSDIRKKKLELALSLMKDKDYERSLKVYSEVLDEKSIDREPEAYLNYLSLLLLQGREGAAKEIFKHQGAFSGKERERLRENIIHALKRESEKQSGEPENSDKGDQEKKNKSDQGQSQGESGEEKQDSNEKEGEEGRPNESQQKEQGKGEKKEERSNDRQGKDQREKKSDEAKGPQDKGESNQPQTWEQKVEEIKTKRRLRKKLPALLQQIEGQDKELQKQQIDTRTNQRSSGRKKDW